MVLRYQCVEARLLVKEPKKGMRVKQWQVKKEEMKRGVQ